MKLCSTFVLLCAVCVYGQSDLDVRLPPAITRQNTELVKFLSEDTLVTLQCEAEGEPAPEYEWLFYGEILDLNNPNIKTFDGVGTIEVTFTPLQEGSYQCFAGNLYGITMTDISYLLRPVLGAFPLGPDKVYPVAESDSLIITCLSTKSVPEPVYRWEIVESREGSESRVVHLNRRVQQDDKGNLYFATVIKTDEQDGNLYQCVTQNPNHGGSRFGSYSMITVNERPERLIAPTNMFYTGKTTGTSVVAIKHKDLRLQCIFSGNPVPTVSWRKKDGPLPNGRFRYENFDTTLVIMDIEDVDEGVFTCFGSNSQGSITQDIRVEVESIPEFENDDDMPTNLNVTQGEDATFRCATVAEPIAQITWYINSREVTEMNKPERVYFEDEDRTLKVRDTCKDCPTPPSDLKVYQCNASNTHGYKFAAGYLNILLPTTLVQAPEDVEMVYGKNVRFECRGASDDSTPIKTTWIKDHDRVVTAKPGRIRFEDNGAVLVIHRDELREDDVEGHYTCIISNGYSTVNKTALLTRPVEPIEKRPVGTNAAPTFGPRAGGTNITVTGRHFFVPTDRLLLGPENLRLECRIVFSNTTMAVGVTPPSNVTDVDLAIAIKFAGVDEPFQLNDVFVYKPNPVVQRIQPLETILQGGTTLTVSGSSLDSVANPVLEITMVAIQREQDDVNETRKHFEQMCAESTAEALLCETPVMDLPEGISEAINPTQQDGAINYNLIGNYSLTFYLGLKLDGLDAYKNISANDDLSEYGTIDVYIAPGTLITTLNEPIVYDGEPIAIQGEQMTSGLRQGDYSVYIGLGTCRVESLSDTALVCTPPSLTPEKLPHRNSQYHLIKVHAGSVLRYEYGMIYYKPELPDTWVLIVIGSLVGAVIILIVIIVILCRRGNREPIERQPTTTDDRTSESNVIYLPPVDETEFFA